MLTVVPEVIQEKWDEVLLMSETVMSTKALPEILMRLIPTEKVRVIETGGMIQLMPVMENTDCPLRGLAADSKLTVDKFLALTHDDKEMRQ